MFTLICTVCGQEFEHRKINAKYCGFDCRYRTQKEQAKIHSKAHYERNRIQSVQKTASNAVSPENSINAVAKRARDMGMSYGQYVIRYSL